MVELEKARLQVVEMFAERKVIVLLCGDFNSPHLEYITGGSIGENQSDWISQEGEEVVGLAFEEETVHIEIDLDMVKREMVEPVDIQECGAFCEHCEVRFSSTAICSYKREHRLGHSCSYGDRRRLALDHASALLFSVVKATNIKWQIWRRGREGLDPRVRPGRVWILWTP
jgi:hypothetical protein